MSITFYPDSLNLNKILSEDYIILNDYYSFTIFRILKWLGVIVNSLKIWIAVFCLLAIANALFLVFVFLKKRPFKTYADIFISLLLIALALRISKSIFYYLFFNISSLYISIGLMGKLAIGPFLLLFVKSNKAQYTFNPIDLLHFLPSLIALSVGWSLYIGQLAVLFWTGTAVLSAYIIYSWYLYTKNEVVKSSKSKLDKSVLIGVSIIWMTFVFQIVSRGIEMYVIGTIISVLVLYWLNYNLTMYTIKKLKSEKINTISKERMNRVASAIDFSFKEEKIYRDSKLTLSKLSEHINQPVYLISQTINKTYNKTFPEYVNHYRVEELKKELEKFGTTNYTIEGIAYSVGFNTPSAFYAAFKKQIGLTPQKFIEENLNKIENRN
ncbi:helix-turn-helix domain-containing protein [Ichthyenterobacterium magnum]|uniref:AraC family transcriptional regulator n=1 Tax=Ichthyenterobacterium magnum TaxID=1230530 RepID=A0A420DLS8_9FLAO|nr:helix-turn-helix transcriptional regulator [Ichthyenterobacterium magnum]RKE95246.1 AraC family transcriptional regulator [Ichthyenterobacterium magnum]